MPNNQSPKTVFPSYPSEDPHLSVDPSLQLQTCPHWSSPNSFPNAKTIHPIVWCALGVWSMIATRLQVYIYIAIVVKGNQKKSVCNNSLIFFDILLMPVVEISVFGMLNLWNFIALHRKSWNFNSFIFYYLYKLSVYQILKFQYSLHFKSCSFMIPHVNYFNFCQYLACQIS